MSNKELIAKAVEKGLLAFDEEQKNVTYVHQNKRLRWSDPEEKVRAQSFASLVLEYGYAARQIDIEVAVEHRVPNIYADLVVYADQTLKKPVILVECKREEASQGELDQAVEQGFGYANSIDADFVWMTSGSRGFTRDAEAEARTQEKRRVTLINLDKLFELWDEHYGKLTDQARRRLPLRSIRFLAPGG